MDKDISDMMKKFSDMMANGSSEEKTSNSSFNFSDISPDMLSQFASLFKKNTSDNNKFNFDMESLLKIKAVMEKMNAKDDPRNNLLQSLKPYLKPSRKEKVDQYISLLNMGKVMEIFKESNGGNKK